MTDGEIMMKAGEILAEHGALTSDYIIKQLGNVLGDHVAVEDWRRVAATVDLIESGSPQ